VTGMRFGTMAIILQLHGPESNYSREKFSNVQPFASQVDYSE
jgi:hypothetical protein